MRYSCLILTVFLASCVTQNKTDPAHQVVIFGSLCADGLFFDSAVEDIVAVRTGPIARQAELNRWGDVFYSDPLDVGESWKVISLSDQWEIPFRTDAPGLLFLGSLVVSGDGSRVTRRPTPTEEDVLRSLLDALWWTTWRRPILERLEEIDH